MPVETFKDENKANRLARLNLENWIAAVAPTLKTYWVDYLFSLSANQPPPNFEVWVELLHAAAKTPEQLPFLLAKVIKVPGRGSEEPLEWPLLTDLLALTFEAANSEAAKLTAADWQGLLELQNSILKTNAHLASRQGQPDIFRLKRQALYLQIITALNRKILETPPEALLAEIDNARREFIGL